mmetsp:Transcript_40195/g.113820  ORF Transcript_40195/g.113820 Transcript_40195/m.113820 type:complete len:254 (+) Transcript_40195:364-1125(+)
MSLGVSCDPLLAFLRKKKMKIGFDTVANWLSMSLAGTVFSRSKCSEIMWIRSSENSLLCRCPRIHLLPSPHSSSRLLSSLLKNTDSYARSVPMTTSTTLPPAAVSFGRLPFFPFPQDFWEQDFCAAANEKSVFFTGVTSSPHHSGTAAARCLCISVLLSTFGWVICSTTCGLSVSTTLAPNAAATMPVRPGPHPSSTTDCPCHSPGGNSAGFWSSFPSRTPHSHRAPPGQMLWEKSCRIVIRFGFPYICTSNW